MKQTIFFSLLLMLLSGMTTWAQIPSTYYSSEAVGSYYLYSIDQNGFASKSGTNSSLITESPSELVTLAAVSESGYTDDYTIKFSDGSYLKRGTYKSTFVWLDGKSTDGTNIYWKFQQVDLDDAAKGYYIISADNYYLNSTQSTYLNAWMSNDTGGEKVYFALISADDYTRYQSSISSLQTIPGTLVSNYATVSSSDANAKWNGTNFGYMNNGSSITFSLNNSTEQPYTLTFDAAAKDAGSQQTVSIKNANHEEVFAAPTFDIITAGWTTYKKYTVGIPSLPVGEYTMTITTSVTGAYGANTKNFVLTAGNHLTLNETDTEFRTFGKGTVTVNRALSSSKWNTLCVPFNMVNPSEWTVKQLTSVEGTTLKFSDASMIEAGKPYLVKPSVDITSFTSQEVTINPTLQATVAGDYTMTGNFISTTVPQNSYFIRDDIFYLADVATVNLGGFRAYVSSSASLAPQVTLFMQDVSTAISKMVSEQIDSTAAYTITGQKVRNGYKGLVIKNGEKFMIK